MRLLVATEARLSRAGDGRIYSDDLHTRAFFERYLGVFEEVVVLARVGEVDVMSPPTMQSVVEDERVSVIALPHYVGLLQLARRWREVAALARRATAGVDAAVLRAPGHVSEATHAALGGVPYAVEVVGDPADAFARGAIRHPARPIVRRHAASALRTLCAGATSVGYVSGLVLPQRYPATNAVTTTTYSSASLAPGAFRAPVPQPLPPRRFVTVTSLEQSYKGVDVLLKAFSRLGPELRLTVVGGGRLRDRYEALATTLGLADRVDFTGPLPGPEAVRRVLAGADAFVLPSLTEGLPRALLEAMAMGLPCIGTTAGGIPELLPAPWMREPGDVAGLAHLIRALAADATTAYHLALRLHERAQDYRDVVLQERRERVLGALRAAAAARSAAR